jgi:hypothetical protein
MHTTFRNIAATFVRHSPEIRTTRSGPSRPKQSCNIVNRPTEIRSPPGETNNDGRGLQAICAGARRKTPGMDGICLEFYITYWTTIKADLTHLLNDVFLNNHITTKQKQGILITTTT